MAASSSPVSECPEIQEELLVLESIYPDYIANLSTETSGSILLRLEISVEPQTPKEIQVAHPNLNLTTSQEEETPRLSLSVLPPLLLHLILPLGYPLQQPPDIVAISTSHSWLTQSDVVREALLQQWTQGGGILCTWVEYIRSGQFLDHPTFASKTDGIVQLIHPTPAHLITHLQEYESFIKTSKFSSMSFPCPLCFSQQPGTKCVQINSCKHIFCRPCLENYWRFLVHEGDVQRVSCPDPECVKKGVEAGEDEVRRVLSEEVLQRWRWLREKRITEKDPTIVLCPLLFCQRPVKKPYCDDENSPWAKLRTCESCSFSFCVFCKRTWHGPVTNCPLTITETFVTDYLASAENSSHRQQIERQYGKANILKLIAKYQEHLENKKWLESSTMPCPGCEVRFEKSVGCNHMTCNKCGQHFCFRCGDRLLASNPYKHFSTPGTKCYNRLFDVTKIDDEWQPIDAFDLI